MGIWVEEEIKKTENSTTLTSRRVCGKCTKAMVKVTAVEKHNCKENTYATIKSCKVYIHTFATTQRQTNATPTTSIRVGTWYSLCLLTLFRGCGR